MRFMRLKYLISAAAALVLSAGAASAATITNDLNLRSGPGTRYSVVTTMPAGARVDVLGCRGSWCRVEWRGRVGYASSSYLASGRGYAAAPRVYYAPPRRAYYGPPQTVFSFGFNTGPRRHYRRHDRWHRRHDGWRYR